LDNLLIGAKAEGHVARVYNLNLPHEKYSLAQFTACEFATVYISNEISARILDDTEEHNDMIGDSTGDNDYRR
jgi:bacterioferritin (cytochrome b1)